MEASTTKVIASTSRGRKLLKRFGIWGFLFFLVKGLVWLGIAAWGVWMAS